MAYVENPIVTGKDFESVMDDVNGNFSEIKTNIDQNFGKWELVGEINISGTPTNFTNNTTTARGEICGYIECNGIMYDKLCIVVSGTIGDNVIFKSGMGCGGAGVNYYHDTLYPNSYQTYYNVNGSIFTRLNVYAGYSSESDSFTNNFPIYWVCKNGTTPGASNMTFKLYGLKKPQWLLDALEII